MSEVSTTGGSPGAEEISAMSAEEAMIVAAEENGVAIVHRRERYPIAGTRAERRAERTIALIFLLGFATAVAFIVVFCGAVPFEWKLPGTGSQDFKYFTPLLGALLGLSLACIGIGVVLWAKWLLPEEESVQDRHDGPGPVEDQLLMSATLVTGFNDLGVARRSMLKSTVGLAGGALAAVPLVALVGAMIKKPNRGVGQSLFHTWYGLQIAQYPNGVPIIKSDGTRIGPADLDAGGIETVFPVNHVREGDSPTLLIRLHPGQTVKARKNQSGFGWGDYVAFSKICTHAGCPASLYEQQTGRLLCPCHQSQFNVLEDAKPVFGPATRSLPKLPLGIEVVGGKQYFVAKGDFPEAIGPAFWERP
ncbi:MAG: Rieske (2Fe-2S) protein [Pseudonocardiales bacterium]|jgi:ubiquinol-cytochrome c reductase iron-sulfur subunit|nr:Rieske (2Fe-2S) protein [Pseudonocardiales bacterium]